MTISLICIGIFIITAKIYMTLIFMILFVFFYQLTQGSFFISLISYIGTPASISMSATLTWAGLLFSSLCAKPIFTTFKQDGTFFVYALLAFAGTLIYAKFLKEVKGLSETQLQELYLPDELKVQERPYRPLNHSGSLSGSGKKWPQIEVQKTVWKIDEFIYNL